MDSKPAELAVVLANLVTVSQSATLQEILQVLDRNQLVYFLVQGMISQVKHKGKGPLG
jgi:hypothetical protein